MANLLIYGATGYTGRQVAAQAKAVGLDTIIAGRDEDKLARLSQQLDLPYRTFDLDDSALITQALQDVTVLLNAAGPFAKTAEPLMQACMETGSHYLDITAEINIYRLAEQLGEAATRAGILLLPGVGGDVVPTDCLALQLARRVQDPRSLCIALQITGPMSRGSAISAKEIVAAGLLARVDGELIAMPDDRPVDFDFGDGPVSCAPLSFGDLVTAWHSTRIPNLAMYFHVTGDAFPQGDLSHLPDGPSAEERDRHRARAVAEITDVDGSTARAIIETVNGYSYTPLAAVEAARRVLAGEHRPGFETPARLFGAGFAETLPGTRITFL